MTVALYNHQSLQAEHGIKSLSRILTKYLSGQGQMWHKYLPLVTFAHNMFNSSNLANHSPYKLVFGRKPKLLLDLETDPDVKVSGTCREYFLQLRKRLGNLHKLLQDFWMKRLALINKDREDFQYNSGDLVYIILPLTSQLRTTSRKFSIKYVGPLVVYKIGHLFSNNTKILLFISNTHSYVPIKLCRVARSIHLFRIRGRLNPENVKLKKNWIWDVLEIDWSDVSITLNDNEIDLPNSVIIPFKERYRARRLLRKHLLLFYVMLKKGKTWFSLVPVPRNLSIANDNN